jgi:hypothetical protein
MYEDFFIACIGFDKDKAFFGIKELYGSLEFFFFHCNYNFNNEVQRYDIK